MKRKGNTRKKSSVFTLYFPALFLVQNCCSSASSSFLCTEILTLGWEGVCAMQWLAELESRLLFRIGRECQEPRRNCINEPEKWRTVLGFLLCSLVQPWTCLLDLNTSKEHMYCWKLSGIASQSVSVLLNSFWFTLISCVTKQDLFQNFLVNFLPVFDRVMCTHNCNRGFLSAEDRCVSCSPSCGIKCTVMHSRWSHSPVLALVSGSILWVC